jgi:hypothetical protein
MTQVTPLTWFLPEKIAVLSRICLSLLAVLIMPVFYLNSRIPAGKIMVFPLSSFNRLSKWIMTNSQIIFTLHHRPKWLNQAVIKSRLKLRQSERLWIRTTLTEHRSLYQQTKKDHHRLIITEKKSAARIIIKKSCNNSKFMWKN